MSLHFSLGRSLGSEGYYEAKSTWPWQIEGRTWSQTYDVWCFWSSGEMAVDCNCDTLAVCTCASLGCIWFHWLQRTWNASLSCLALGSCLSGLSHDGGHWVEMLLSSIRGSIFHDFSSLAVFCRILLTILLDTFKRRGCFLLFFVFLAFWLCWLLASVGFLAFGFCWLLVFC